MHQHFEGNERNKARANRSLRFKAALFLSAGALLVPAAASAAPTDNKSISQLKNEREAVRQKKATAAANVDALEASDAEITTALNTLNENVSGQASLVEEARRAQAQAEEDEAAAKLAEQVASDELDALREDLRTQAVSAYVSAGKDDFLELLSADSLTDTNTKQAILDATTQSNLDVEERFRGVQEDLENARQRAEQARAKAEEKRAEVQSELEKLESAQTEQEEFLADVEDRLDRALGEAQSLASLDSSLSKQISGEQKKLADELSAQRAAAAARASSAGASTPTPRSSSSTGAVSLPTSGGNGIVNVQGIRVDSSISANVNNMLNAARADGVNLAGGGFRDPAGQISVRKSNCGTSNYAIYEMPSSSCSPPTARPGRSMHEQGLAIDFTEGGRTLTRSSAGYRWLSANAASYGLYNLPSEAWHWSTNGN